MRPVGSRKDHRFDSDGQIKASRSRGINEAREMINEQLESLSTEDYKLLNRLRKRASRCNIYVGIYQGQFYLQHFEDTTPYLFDTDLNHIDLFLAGYIEGNNIIESDEQKLLNSLNKVDNIFQSEADWEYKYDRIFGMAKEINPLLKNLNLELDYYDPDTSYEEDVRAYVNALNQIKKNLETHL